MQESEFQKAWRHFSNGSEAEWEILRTIEEKNTIIKVTDSDGTKILKIHKETYASKSGLEDQGRLSDAYRAAGIPAVEILPSLSGGFCGEYEEKGKVYLTTAEAFVEGSEINNVAPGQVREIGRMLGKMHLAGSRAAFRFGYGTSWSMFGGNASDAFGEYDENELMYKELMEACLSSGMHKEAAELVHRLYQKKRERVRKLWTYLPSGPVQGDFCPYNMRADRNGRISGFFDFNLAGDEVFVNELAALAVYYAFSSPKQQGMGEGACLRSFLQGYRSIRRLKGAEEEVLPLLLQLHRPFRFDRIERITGLFASSPLEAGEKMIETAELLTEEYAV